MSYGNEIIKRIYDTAPYQVKNIFAASYGILQRKKRYGSIFYKQIELLSESQYWSNEQLFEYQAERIDLFLNDIYDKVSYYGKNPAYLNLISDYSGYKNMPVLPKHIVKQSANEFYNQNLKNILWGHTSGTTGSAMKFPISIEAYQKEYAFRYLHYNWAGINLLNREKVAMCAGHPVSSSARITPPFWSYDKVNNHLFFSSYHLSWTNLKFYIEKLETFDPLLLHGYPSSIYLLALAYEKYGKKKLNLRSVITSSETLLNFQRKKIEEIFQVKAYNWYGTSEMSANIVECEKGELHLKAEHSYIEILNSSDLPCKPGETGRIISTNFNNSAFPLLRYDVGDMVEISENQISKCGRSGLLINQVEGRVEDYILTPDGRLVGRLDHIFKDSLNIIEAQLEQQNVEEVILRIVAKPGYSVQDENLILKEALTRLGKSIRISFEYVDKIPRLKNGKMKFIISKINALENYF